MSFEKYNSAEEKKENTELKEKNNLKETVGKALDKVREGKTLDAILKVLVVFLNKEGFNGDLTEEEIIKITHNEEEKKDKRNKEEKEILKSDFLKNGEIYAKEVEEKYNIPWQVCLSQAALETGWGKHVKNENYFGIKATKASGKYFSNEKSSTTEFVNGEKIRIKDNFESHFNMRESFLRYGEFLVKNQRYSEAFDFAPKKNNGEKNSNYNPKLFAQEIHKSGYATDPEYSNKLASIISRINKVA